MLRHSQNNTFLTIRSHELSSRKTFSGSRSWRNQGARRESKLSACIQRRIQPSKWRLSSLSLRIENVHLQDVAWQPDNKAVPAGRAGGTLIFLLGKHARTVERNSQTMSAEFGAGK